MEHEERLKAALADRYQIEREIGSGGMATVYLAEDLKHHRQVAVKVLDPGLARTLGPERFLREIETAANLTHPHILPLFDSGEADGFLFYVMPYVKGESLRSRLTKEKQLPVEDAIQITREISDALAYAHGEGVIHRDVKPANIMLGAGHAVLADFGVAHAVAEAKEDRLTRTGTSLGTPSYMSPEQATGEQDLDGRSDQYALGCVLFEMLAGHPPFTGVQADAIIRQHVAEEPPSITRTRPSVAGEIAEVITRSLAKSPADRFKTTGEMASALALTTTPRKKGEGPLSHWVRVGLAAAALVAVSAGVFWALNPNDGRLQNPDQVVVVLPLQNETGDAGLDYLANLAPNVITEGLGRVGISRVVSFSNVFRAAQAGGPGEPGFSSLQESWAEETGANLAVIGSYFPLGDSVQFRLQVIDQNREVLANVEPVTGPLRDPQSALPALQMEACASIVDLVAPGDKRRRSFQGVHVPSPEAHRVYLDALTIFHRGRYADAEAELERAASLDPDFLQPLMQLVAAKLNLQKRVEADSICRIIEDRYDELSREQQLKNDQRCAMVRGERYLALERSKQLEEFRPNEVYHLGMHARALNRPIEAVEAHEKYDPHRSSLDWDWYSRVLWQLADSHHRLGDYEEQLRIARAGRRDFLESWLIVREEVTALAALGRLGDLETAMADWLSLRAPDATPYPVYHRAAEELESHGFPDAARGIWERVVHWHETEGFDPIEGSFEEGRNLGRALLALGRLDEARFLEDLAEKYPDDLDGQLFVGVLRAKLGDRAGAERVAQRLAEWDQPLLLGLNRSYQARIMANLGKLDEAVRLLRQAVTEGQAAWATWYRDSFLKPLRGYPAFEEFLEPRG